LQSDAQNAMMDIILTNLIYLSASLVTTAAAPVILKKAKIQLVIHVLKDITLQAQ
jgi:hypothetical protein